RVLVFASPELTNTRSSQTTGVAAEGPGNAAVHRTFLVLENSDGKFFSGLDPLKSGPRQCAQLAAPAACKMKEKARAGRIGFIDRNGCGYHTEPALFSPLILSFKEKPLRQKN